MSTFTKLYLTTLTAPYTPATIRGAWNATASSVTKMLTSVKESNNDAITTVAVAETSTTDAWDVLLYRGVSGPLGAQTITGNLNVMLGVIESDAEANDNFHIHCYVTQGDSDTPRGDLLTDYTESAGTNEWTATTATNNGLALNAATAMSSLAISANDRIVVEIGYVARNTSATSYTGTLNYGTTVSGVAAADLTAGAAGASLAGYISFSNAITEANVTVRLTQAPIRVLRNANTTVNAVRLTQAPVRVLRNAATSVNSIRLTQASVRVLYNVYTAPAGGGSGGIFNNPFCQPIRGPFG